MDKNCVQILAEVTGIGEEYLYAHRDALKYDVIYKAMKIFGKQCFIAGRNDFFGDTNMIQDVSISELRADNYLNKLEEKK